MSRRFTRWPTRASLLAAFAVLVGCRDQPPAGEPPGSSGSGSGSQTRPGVMRVMRASDLSEAERRYGVSARPEPSVTLQPDVVLLPAGAAAVRSGGSDGISWTLDPDAQGASAITPGKVLFLTSRVAGRVLAVGRTTEGLRVVLGPVELTDIIRDGKFEMDQPVEFDQMLEYTVPEVFDAVLPVAPIVAQAPGELRFLPASFMRSPAVEPQFKLWPLFGSDGFGLEIVSNEKGAHFLGRAKLFIDRPRITFHLDIQGGRLLVCEVRITGAFGFALTFEATLPNPQAANINQDRFSPKELSLTAIGNGTPFGVVLRQAIRLQTAFTSSGAIRAVAQYKLKGDLHAGYRNGTWSIGGPVAVSAVENMEAFLHTAQGAAIGTTGLVLVHSASLMVGVGAFGFMTGPYARLNTAITITRGSDAGITPCKRGTFVMAASAGVGYRIPDTVAEVINTILSTLHIQETIKSEGGIESSPVYLINFGRYTPAVEACKG